MKTPDLERSFAEVGRIFSASRPEMEVCAYVFGLLEKLGPQFENVTLGGVAIALGWENDNQKKKAIAVALDFLARGVEPILERQYELWADDARGGVLDEPLCLLTQEQVRSALEEGSLDNPITGEAIPNFLDLITVIYAATDYARRISVQ